MMEWEQAWAALRTCAMTDRVIWCSLTGPPVARVMCLSRTKSPSHSCLASPSHTASWVGVLSRRIVFSVEFDAAPLFPFL